jgi:acetyl esterase
MALDPQCRAFLDQLAAIGGKPLHELTPAEARARAMPPELGGEEQPVHAVADRKIPGDGGLLALRVYRPSAAVSLPGLVWPTTAGAS